MMKIHFAKWNALQNSGRDSPKGKCIGKFASVCLKLEWNALQIFFFTCFWIYDFRRCVTAPPCANTDNLSMVGKCFVINDGKSHQWRGKLTEHIHNFVS